MSKMSINTFKKHPGNKVTFNNRAIFSGELKIMGSRPKIVVKHSTIRFSSGLVQCDY